MSEVACTSIPDSHRAVSFIRNSSRTSWGVLSNVSSGVPAIGTDLSGVYEGTGGVAVSGIRIRSLGVAGSATCPVARGGLASPELVSPIALVFASPEDAALDSPLVSSFGTGGVVLVRIGLLAFAPLGVELERSEAGGD